MGMKCFQKKYAAILLIFILVITGAAGCGRKKAAVALEQEDTKKTQNAEAGKTVKPNVTQKPEESTGHWPEETENPEEEASSGEIVTDQDAINGMAEEICSHMSLEEKIGQLFIVNMELLDDSQGSFYEFRSVTEPMKEKIKEYPIGGVVFFTRNIDTREQTISFIEELQKETKVPLFISVDEEGGEVARIASNPNMQTTKFPDMEWIGANEDETYAYHMGSTIGSEIKELGFNLNFAPVADVRTNESNTEIGNRSFGNNAKLVSKMVKQVVNGLQEQNISATLKHFPGHGDAGDDSHKGAVNIENDLNRLREIDFVPFKAGIRASVDCIMVSHISISRITESTEPASFSELVIQTILREELGFHGIVITDAMDMKAITERYAPEEASLMAVKAGADIVLMPERLPEAFDSILKAVISGDLEEDRIDESVERILRTKIRRGMIRSNTPLIKN